MPGPALNRTIERKKWEITVCNQKSRLIMEKTKDVARNPTAALQIDLPAP